MVCNVSIVFNNNEIVIVGFYFAFVNFMAMQCSEAWHE